MGINSSAALTEAYEKLIQRVKRRAPEAAIASVAVEKMITDVDYELILGAKKDKDFGSVILFGMGGTTAEFIKDFSIGLPPLNQTLGKDVDAGHEGIQNAPGVFGANPQQISKGSRRSLLTFPI